MLLKKLTQRQLYCIVFYQLGRTYCRTGPCCCEHIQTCVEVLPLRRPSISHPRWSADASFLPLTQIPAPPCHIGETLHGGLLLSPLAGWSPSAVSDLPVFANPHLHLR